MNGLHVLRTGLLTGIAAGALWLASGQTSTAAEIKTLGYTPQAAPVTVQNVQYLSYYPGRYYSFRPYNGRYYAGYPGYYGNFGYSYPGYWPNSYATGGAYYQYSVPNPYFAGRAFTYGYPYPGGYRYYYGPW